MPLTPFERLLEQQRLPAQPSRALIRREYFYFLRRLAIAGLSLAILMVSGATSYAAFEGSFAGILDSCFSADADLPNLAMRCSLEARGFPRRVCLSAVALCCKVLHWR